MFVFLLVIGLLIIFFRQRHEVVNKRLETRPAITSKLFLMSQDGQFVDNHELLTVLADGTICISVPNIPIIPSADIKVCAQTCGGGFFPTGVRATVAVNGKIIWSGVVIGNCS